MLQGSTNQARSIQHYVNKKDRREQRRAAKRAKDEVKQQNTRAILFERLAEIEPMTANQERVFDSYDAGQNQVLIGCPGTGKTFLAFYLALSDLLDEDSPHERILIVRSTVQGRDQGFMPGGPKEKSAMFEAPYEAIVSELFKRNDVYATLKQQGKIVFTSTSFVRGQTFDKSIIIFDEFQNCTDIELHSVITRYGKDTRLICCGDSKQDDLKKHEFTGFHNFLKVASRMNSIDVIEFGVEDIVRSGFVKEYMILRHELIT